MNNHDLLKENTQFMPLAARMRPKHIGKFYGQSHLLAEGKPLYEALNNGRLHSMILWGPPGTGKTTLARLLAQSAKAHIIFLSAVLAGVKEVRAAVEEAKVYLQQGRATILFIDEVHRFNKAQQDAFLPYVEDGLLTLIGATTENPSFALNNALLSRARVYVFNHLTNDEIITILKNALYAKEQGLGQANIHANEAFLSMIAEFSNGDARYALNLLEVSVELLHADEKHNELTEVIAEQVLTRKSSEFDNKGEYFYDLISALHKSVRGSDVDASLYWFCRMLDAGCDLNYLLRRLVRMASEDIGNADPRALTLTLNAWDAYERLGSPEGDLAIGQAVIYLAVAAKSNAVYAAFNAALQDAKKYPDLEVPLHLRNAPTKLMKQLGYGKAYRYAHDYPNAYVPNEQYRPQLLQSQQYYQPVNRGVELKIREKLSYLKNLDQQEHE
ncbi:MAG: recombination factor protein RarA [Legionellales bacterium]|nr:recombination factor protein RarA [Legionellales bacterium]|tara:strand:- start:755 stop:2083 length:1329 start_codon:yes stop_codon:yes gene_type:complete